MVGAVKRLAPLLGLLALLALALPAVAAKPKDGSFKGEGTYTTSGEKYEAVVKLKVKNGKIVRFYAKSKPVPTGNTLTPKKPIKVKKSGKFSAKRDQGIRTWTIKGRFTKRGKAVGTFKIESPDSVGSFPKTRFTVKRKG